MSSDHARATQSKRSRLWRRLGQPVGAVVVVLSGIWFAWDQGALDPNDYKLVQAALDETDDDEAQVSAIVGIFEEQVALKRTGWRRRHGPWRYSLDAYVDALVAIMEREPTSEAARLAATWVVRMDNGAVAGRSVRILSQHHLLATPSAPLSRLPFDEAQDVLERQIALQPDAALRAQAQLALANRHLLIEELARDASEILALKPEDQEEAAFFSGGLSSVKFAESRDADAEHAAAVALLVELREGAAQHLPPEEAELAEALFMSHLELGLGSIAPEIIGANLDGNEMRLSDFRGKVVVLDFWGHW